MTALPSRVPGDTTKLTTPEVVTMPELGWWSRLILLGAIRWGLGLLRLVMVPSAIVGRPTM